MLKLGVIADLHYSNCRNPLLPARRGDYAALLLKRALRWMEISGWPDAVLIAGDLLDPAGAADLAAFARLEELAKLLATVPVPVLTLPGNHDMEPEMFYGVIPPVPDFLEVGGARIVPFIDPERPGWNAERLPEEMAKFDRARAGFSGPLIAFQHCSLFPPGAEAAPYNYVNAAEIIRKMEECGCVLSISGHAHGGAEPVRHGNCTWLTIPALCESPFRFAEVTLEDSGEVDWQLRELRLPEEFAWEDNHTHTPFAYCSENMDLRREAELMEMFHLASASVTEHSAHLLFSRDAYWGRKLWFYEGMESARRIDRAPAFREYFRGNATQRFRFGLEVDIDCRGELVIPPGMRPELAFEIGAVHMLTPNRPHDEMAREFLFLVEQLGRAGFKVLAHPLRILNANQIPAEPLYDRLIAILKKYDMASEVNFHQNSADPEFTRRCMESGLKLSFGTDSHNLAFFGFLQPQIELVRQLGFNGDWKDLLYGKGELFQ